MNRIFIVLCIFSNAFELEVGRRAKNRMNSPFKLARKYKSLAFTHLLLPQA